MKLLRGSKEEFLMLLNEHLSNKTTERSKRRPYFEFNYYGDNYKVSVQASEYHYCTPQEDNMEYYEEVELGFPDFLFSESFILNYAEDTNTPKDAVYPYVPLEELAKELELLVLGGKYD